MNTNDVNKMLIQAGQALARNDKKNAVKIIFNILNNDINNGPAWKFLYRVLESKLPFGEFQAAVTKKYFPNQYHLLSENRADNQINSVVPSRQETPKVVIPNLEVNPAAIQITSAPQTSPINCAYCGKPVLQEGQFCSNCGNPINPEKEILSSFTSATSSIPKPPLDLPQQTTQNDQCPDLKQSNSIDENKTSILESTSKKRGCRLTTYLLYLMIGNSLKGFYLVFVDPTTQSQQKSELFLFYSIFIVSIIGVWKWKRWGVYVYVGMLILFVFIIAGVATPGVEIIGVGVISVFMFLEVALFIFLVRPIWHQMD